MATDCTPTHVAATVPSAVIAVIAGITITGILKKTFHVETPHQRNHAQRADT
jgi:hypothetical protein